MKKIKHSTLVITAITLLFSSQYSFAYFASEYESIATIIQNNLPFCTEMKQEIPSQRETFTNVSIKQGQGQCELTIKTKSGNLSCLFRGDLEDKATTLTRLYVYLASPKTNYTQNKNAWTHAQYKFDDIRYEDVQGGFELMDKN